MKYRAVLFDLDGVLLKSMEQHLKAWQHAFSHFQVNIKEGDFYQLEGRGVKAVVKILIQKYGIDAKLRQVITDTKIAYYNKNFKAEFYDGIYTLLDTLHRQHIKMAVVTGGMRDRVYKIVEDYFQDYFSAIVTSDDVQKTKPSPEPYLKAASMINHAPEECVVIENAPMGIESGKAAGMTVIAICTTLGKNYLSGADVITDSFFEILDYLTAAEMVNSRIE